MRSHQAQDFENFTGDLKVLANDIALLQEDIQASEERLALVENAVAIQIRDQLNAPQVELPDGCGGGGG